MNHIKIAFFDIDGTLVNPLTKKVSEKTIETLQKLKSKGVILCIATGRTAMAVPKFEGIEFDAYLTFNGSYCFTNEKVIHSTPFSDSDVKIILQNAEKINRPVSVATADRLAANGIDQDLRDYYELAELTLEVADDFEDSLKEEVFQIMLGCREHEHAGLVEGTENAKVAISWDRAVDIIPANSGKGSGIQKILEYFNITKEESLAFGDGQNDIEMFEAVGHGIAMGNAAEKLKKVADTICKTCAEDGIYHYCLDNALI